MRENCNICTGNFPWNTLDLCETSWLSDQRDCNFKFVHRKKKKNTKNFVTWEVSRCYFLRVIITKGRNALAVKSFGSTLTPCTSTLYKSMCISRRVHTLLVHHFWKCAQRPYSLLQALINTNSTMIIMSLHSFPYSSVTFNFMFLMLRW